MFTHCYYSLYNLGTTPGTLYANMGKIDTYLRLENLKNSTLSSGTYLYRQYMGVPPPRVLPPMELCKNTSILSKQMSYMYYHSPNSASHIDK